MTTLAKNTAANLVGNAWTAAITLIFIPIYIQYLGMEAYGLIGIAAMITLMLSLADFGISAAFMREMAREWKEEQDIREGRASYSLLLMIYIPISLLFGGVAVLAAPYIASDWVNVSHLTASTVEDSIRLIGMMAMFGLMNIFFSSGLMGLQKQVLANVLAVLISTIQSVGALLILEYYSADILSFFVWQAGFSGFVAVVTGIIVHVQMPGRGFVFSTSGEHRRKLIRFAMGMGGISIFTLLLTQTDKVLLSKLLSLEAFGLYTLGVVIAMSLKKGFGPLYSAVYPRLTELVRGGMQERLQELYHLASQAMSVLILPASLLLMIYSREIVYVWTGEDDIAIQIDTLISIMVAGTALNALVHMPLALQLAHGRTRLMFVTNLIAVIFYVPAVYFLSTNFGGEGAASAWLLLNFGYLFLYVPVMHKSLMQGRLREWYVYDILLPLLAAMAPLLLAWPLFSMASSGRVELLFGLAVSYLLSLLSSAYAAKRLRVKLWQKWIGG